MAESISYLWIEWLRWSMKTTNDLNARQTFIDMIEDATHGGLEEIKNIFKTTSLDKLFFQFLKNEKKMSKPKMIGIFSTWLWGTTPIITSVFTPVRVAQEPGLPANQFKGGTCKWWKEHGYCNAGKNCQNAASHKGLREGTCNQPHELCGGSSGTGACAHKFHQYVCPFAVHFGEEKHAIMCPDTGLCCKATFGWCTAVPKGSKTLFAIDGQCTRQNETPKGCPGYHLKPGMVPVPNGLTPVDPSTVPCPMYITGYCPAGPSCGYSHRLREPVPGPCEKPEGICKGREYCAHLIHKQACPTAYHYGPHACKNPYCELLHSGWCIKVAKGQKCVTNCKYGHFRPGFEPKKPK